MADCFRKTMAREGVKGLYAGAASPLIGAMAHNAGVFFSYGMSKKVTQISCKSEVSSRFSMCLTLSLNTVKR